MDSQERNTFIICISSFFITCATLMLASTFTLYHEHVLHIPKMKLGSIQAYATLAMYGTKFFSGIIVDIFKNYKVILIIGSILTMITRVMFAFVTAPFSIFMLRSAERLTKGLRAVPTDAFLTINADKASVGSAVAKKQAYYTAGGIAGALIASVFLYMRPAGFTTLYILTVVPGLIATVAFFFLQPIPFTEKKSESSNVRWSQIKEFPPALYFIYFLAYALTVARIGENFLGHRFYEMNIAMAFIPLVYIILDIPWFATSLGLVKILDKNDSKKLILWGMGLLFATNVLLMQDNLALMVLGTLCGGAHLGLMQGVITTLVAKYTPKEVRGTAFALYYVFIGLGMFTSIKLTAYFAHTFNMWKAGFLGQTGVSLVLLVCVIFIPKRFFNREA